MKTTKETLTLPPQWQTIQQLAVTIAERLTPPSRPELWPIYGLAHRAANLARATSVLVLEEFWSEVLILSRTVLEIRITMEWLLCKDMDERLRAYVDGIAAERRRLGRKMAEGVSVTAQIMNDIFGDSYRQEGGVKSSWPKIPIREMSREVDLERNYDVMYWLQSIFAHAHPLSILDYQPEQHDQLLSAISTNDPSGMPRYLALTGLPASFLHLFSTASAALHLGIEPDIERSWPLVHQAIAGYFGCPVSYSDEEFPMGDVELRSNDGTVKHYSPKRRHAPKSRNGAGT